MSAARPTLRLVPLAREESAWSWFCGHCAAPSPDGEAPAPTARVCQACGFGLLIETREDVAPQPRDAFLIVDASLLVQAMSAQAESLLSVREDMAVHRPLAELLVPAEVERSGGTGMASAVAEIVGWGEQDSHAFVRPWNTYGVRIRARITACGPPRAALILLERPRAAELRAV